MLGCKALVPHSSASKEGPLTATASVTTDGENGDSPASGTTTAVGAVGGEGAAAAGGGGGDVDGVGIDGGGESPPPGTGAKGRQGA